MKGERDLILFNCLQSVQEIALKLVYQLGIVIGILFCLCFLFGILIFLKNIVHYVWTQI